jgi:AraC-like DNA-binding protein
VHNPEPTFSVRLLWPMLRIAGTDRWLVEQLAQMGVSLRDVAGAENRVRRSTLIRLLEELVQRGSDPSIGLSGGQAYQTGDLDALEYAATSAPTLREAIASAGRFIRLLHSGLETEIEERGEHAFWRFRAIDGAVMPAAANDFTLALALTFARTHTGRSEPTIEVHVEHAPVAYASEYVKFFGGTVRFGMPHNALVFRREYLATPMLQASSALHAAFEQAAREQLARVAQRLGVRGKVRELVIAQLRSGDTRMSTVADNLAMSVATLRRRLDEEGTSHTEILDEVRHELAKGYLRDPRLAISEIAFMLGFAHVAAFYKAFRRWTSGGTPASFRGRMATADLQPSRSA